MGLCGIGHLTVALSTVTAAQGWPQAVVEEQSRPPGSPGWEELTQDAAWVRREDLGAGRVGSRQGRASFRR